MHVRTNLFADSDKSPLPNWDTLQAASATYKISDWTLRQMIARGEVSAVRIGPRLIRVDLNSIARALRVVGGE